jgi:hypothetical protein
MAATIGGRAMSHHDATASERLTALLAAQGVTGRFNPASATDLAQANAVAPLPAPLTQLYLNIDMIRFGDLEPFHIEDYLEVNGLREDFGPLSAAVFVASDLADGWFFVDPGSFMGLAPDFVFWVERGMMELDECVPVAETLIDLFEASASGQHPWRAPPLGDRAVTRLQTRISEAPHVVCHAPLDPATRGAQITPRVRQILEHSDGFWLEKSGRVFTGFAEITPLHAAQSEMPDAHWIGTGPHGVRYATTTGSGWRDLPADRMILIAPDTDPNDGVVLGRTADVWNLWIRQDEEK